MNYIQDRADEAREKELLALGKQMQELGNFNEALKFLNEVIEGNSKSSEAFYLVANVFHQSGEIGKAIKAFRKVLEIDPYHTDAAISLSVLYNDIGKYEKAREIFESAKKKVETRKNNDTGLINNPKPNKEVKEAQPVNDPHINKKFAYKHLEIADLYMSYSRFDEALFDYKKAIALDPNNLDARIKVSKVYAKKGLAGKAVDELVRVKNEYPNYFPARMALGLLYFSNQKIIEAQTEWQKILEKDPNHAEAKMYLDMSESATETVLN